jgi:peptidoglycan/LPS O-acetylase OafA/YrhL
MTSDAGAYPRTLNRQIHGLRGFSALAVFVYHVYGMGTLWNFWPAAFAPVAPIFAAGKHGVEIFFMISGYLITGSLIRHGRATAFLVDRAIRIYPVFMTIQLLVFGLGPVIHYKWLAGISPGGWALAFIENGLFLPGLFDLKLAQLNAWSLGYEAAFYLISAGVFVLARRLGARPATAALLIVLAVMIPAYPRGAFFLPGVAIFFLARRLKVVLPALWRAASLPSLVAMLVILTIAEGRPGLFYLALLPGFVCFISIVEGKCALSALLRLPALQYLGTISYSFYLWSPVVTYPMKLVIERALHGPIGDVAITLLFAGMGFAASIAVAGLSYRWLEDGAGRWLHRRVAANADPRLTASPRSAG